MTCLFYPKAILTANIWIAAVLFVPACVFSQSHNYWTRSFNEESSLLSGAVVGGGSGPSAIYYNPANISEVAASQLSVNASLFSFEFIKVENALGDGISLNSTIANIEPRFLSYMIKGKKHPGWSIEIAYLNNENGKEQLTESVDKRIDILSHVPGRERYFALYNYSDQFRDDWVCLGGSLKLSSRIFFGLGFYVAIKSLEYASSLTIEAYSTDDSVNVQDYPASLASSANFHYLKFNDYRMKGKLGFTYKAESFSVGVSFTSPSAGGIYSDGKKVIHKESQFNITDPETGELLPSYTIVDYKEKKAMSVSFRTPFSVSAGFTFHLADGKRTLFASAEYFAGIKPYKMVEAEESNDITSGTGAGEIAYTDWLTFAGGARPVFNVAVGYSWTLKKDLLLMAGFRTDFNYQKNLDFEEMGDFNKIENLDLDLYYMTCGLSWNILGHDIITGLQYTLGRDTGEKQIANLADPVEYSPVENLPLQGDRKNDMTSLYNAISLYFGAAFNFGGEKK